VTDSRQLSDEEVRTFAAERRARRALEVCSVYSPDYARRKRAWIVARQRWSEAVARSHVRACEELGLPHLYRVR
jgi:hypothetical protein